MKYKDAEARGASKAIERTINLLSDKLGISKPRKGTPKQRRQKMITRIARKIKS